ncbi:ribonuclease HIII [Streptococcus didelphis]|uniref:ribonuclease HIII n=1 Tax=Streptococcus didelphis TaxID=102886 RepID=UPI00037CE713|nr:ribonuclease HIII [Streptococcus didelphis]WMB29374.1 ribonuclease HIII [Streptococcus didelphis]
METIVVKNNPKLKKELISKLKTYQLAPKNPYLEFVAKYQGTTISLYSSGKLVFQGGKASQVAQELGHYSPSENSAPQTKSQALPLIGSDEVGNGSYFGGIAVVASYVEPKDHDFLRKLGVGDSKTLTDTKIKELAPILEKAIKHKALLLSPQKYNEMVGKNKAYNAVSIKVALHNQAIFLLLQTGVEPEKIVIDAFTSQGNYEKHLIKEKNHFPNPLTFVEKAEGQYLAVAVSSIIARNLFLENLKNLGEELGYTLPSGAGQASDKVASHLLAAYGISSLDYSAKLHFANTQKAQTLLNSKK